MYQHVSLSTTPCTHLRARQAAHDLLLPETMHFEPTHPVIPVDIPSTDPPLPRELTPPMQHPPVIKDQHPAGRQLLPVLVLLLLEQRVELARCIVPRLDLLNRQLDTGSVGRVPAHAQQVACRRVVLENGEAAVRLDADALVARGVRVHVHRGQDIVGFLVLLQELGCDFEAVDEQGRAAGAVRVREQMERL